MTDFARQAYKAVLYGNGDRQQQQSVASALALRNGLAYELCESLKSIIDLLETEGVVMECMGSPVPFIRLLDSDRGSAILACARMRIEKAERP